MKYFLLFLLSFLLSCGGSPKQPENSNTEAIITYNGKEVSRRGSRYIGAHELRALLDRGEEVIVVFSADWCGACELTRTALEKAKLKTEVYYINVDEPWVAKLAGMMSIKSVPLMIHTSSEGKTIATKVGPGQIVIYLITRY